MAICIHTYQRQLKRGIKASNISNRIDIDSFRPSLLNDMRSGNVQVVHRSIATNQARGGLGQPHYFNEIYIYLFF